MILIIASLTYCTLSRFQQPVQVVLFVLQLHLIVCISISRAWLESCLPVKPS